MFGKPGLVKVDVHVCTCTIRQLDSRMLAGQAGSAAQAEERAQDVELGGSIRSATAGPTCSSADKGGAIEVGRQPSGLADSAQHQPDAGPGDSFTGHDSGSQLNGDAPMLNNSGSAHAAQPPLSAQHSKAAAMQALADRAVNTASSASDRDSNYRGSDGENAQHLGPFLLSESFTADTKRGEVRDMLGTTAWDAWGSSSAKSEPRRGSEEHQHGNDADRDNADVSGSHDDDDVALLAEPSSPDADVEAAWGSSFSAEHSSADDAWAAALQAQAAEHAALLSKAPVAPAGPVAARSSSDGDSVGASDSADVWEVHSSDESASETEEAAEQPAAAAQPHMPPPHQEQFAPHASESSLHLKQQEPAVPRANAQSGPAGDASLLGLAALDADDIVADLLGGGMAARDDAEPMDEDLWGKVLSVAGELTFSSPNASSVVPFADGKDVPAPESTASAPQALCSVQGNSAAAAIGACPPEWGVSGDAVPSVAQDASTARATGVVTVPAEGAAAAADAWVTDAESDPLAGVPQRSAPVSEAPAAGAGPAEVTAASSSSWAGQIVSDAAEQASGAQPRHTQQSRRAHFRRSRTDHITSGYALSGNVLRVVICFTCCLQLRAKCTKIPTNPLSTWMYHRHKSLVGIANPICSSRSTLLHSSLDAGCCQ
jgi:hypothetical protein